MWLLYYRSLISNLASYVRDTLGYQPKSDAVMTWHLTHYHRVGRPIGICNTLQKRNISRMERFHNFQPWPSCSTSYFTPRKSIHMHRKGYLHTEVKPEDIILRSFFRCSVTQRHNILSYFLYYSFSSVSEVILQTLGCFHCSSSAFENHTLAIFICIYV